MRKILCTCALSALTLTFPLLAAKKAISPPEFANPKVTSPPFSPGIMVDGTLYVAGQIGRDLKSGDVPSDFEQEVKTCLDNIGIILKAAGMTFDDAVSVQVYLTDIGQFAKMNGVYTTYFKDPRPARTTVGVAKLAAPTAHIEITVTARKSK